MAGETMACFCGSVADLGRYHVRYDEADRYHTRTKCGPCVSPRPKPDRPPDPPECATCGRFAASPVNPCRCPRPASPPTPLVGAPHGDPADCPAYYDYCRCTVETLAHNIARAEKAEAERDEARGAAELLVAAEEVSQAMEAKIRAVTGEPSGGHDLADEVLGLLRVAQGQRDDAEARASAAEASLRAIDEALDDCSPWHIGGTLAEAVADLRTRLCLARADVARPGGWEEAARAEASLLALREVAEGWNAKAAAYDAESEKPTKNDDERRTALAKFIAARALRDCVREVRSALGGDGGRGE